MKKLTLVLALVLPLLMSACSSSNMAPGNKEAQDAYTHLMQVGEQCNALKEQGKPTDTCVAEYKKEAAQYQILRDRTARATGNIFQ